MIDWLKNYKTSDGKPVNKLKQEHPTTTTEAEEIIVEVSGFYQKLISGKVENTEKYELPAL